MDLANNERIGKLNEQIQVEKDSHQLTLLVEELTRLLDEEAASKKVQSTNGESPEPFQAAS